MITPGLVSVIIPVFNREDYVAEAIKSVLSQTYKNIEAVLINDGSSDISLDILESFQKKYPELIKVINQPNQGQIVARNNGIHGSSGEFVAFLDSDDSWHKNKLELQIPHFKNDIGLVYSGVEFINSDGKITGVDIPASIKGSLFPYLLVKNRMVGGTVVVRRSVLDEVGFFDEAFQAAENWDLWLRVSIRFSTSFVAEPLVKYRIHAGNMSGDNKLMLEAKRNIIAKHCDINSRDQNVKRGSRLALADYYYRVGVFHFGLNEYWLALNSFFRSNRYSLFYSDSVVRIIRSCLGNRGNIFLRFLKRNFTRL
jgi:glycosyltransferase involved in cell wall biosynthesis